MRNMGTYRHADIRLFCVVGIATLVACKDPTTFDAPPDLTSATASEPPEQCAASSEWLPSTPLLPQFEPLAHPETECPFYRAAWQSFLVATQPAPDGAPAIRSYPTLDDVFISKMPHAVRNTAQRAWLGDI